MRYFTKFAAILFLQVLLMIDVFRGDPCVSFSGGSFNVGGDLAVIPPPTVLLSNGQNGKSGAVFESLYTTGCCRVIIGWALRVNTAICPIKCRMTFSVYNNPTIVTPYRATLRGSNANLDISPASDGIARIDILPQDQIPVQPDYFLGWDGTLNYINSDDAGTGLFCGTSSVLLCTTFYLESATSSQVNGTPTEFTNYGAISNKPRYFPISAVVDKGDTPKFTNLPASTTIPSTAAVTTSVYNVLVLDLNTRDTLQTTLIRACPPNTPFAFNSITRDVTLASSVASSPFLVHTLTFLVTDGCTSSEQTLDIAVIDTSSSTTSSTTPNSALPSTTKQSSSSTGSGFFSTTDGKVLIGLIAAALAVALAAAIALCCLCYCLSKMGALRCSGAGAGANSGSIANPMYAKNAQTNPLFFEPSSNPMTNNYMEPRPPSYRADPQLSKNRVKPQTITELERYASHDAPMRTVTPSRYFRDQLFW